VREGSSKPKVERRGALEGGDGLVKRGGSRRAAGEAAIMSSTAGGGSSGLADGRGRGTSSEEE
jgi:hypothetical protein